MKLLFYTAFLVLFTPFTSHAAEKIMLPTEPVLLTVEGNISSFNRPDRKADWDLKMLKSLGTTTFRTSTPWLEGVSTFEGVLMRDVLYTLGAAGKTVTAYAADGYSDEIEIADFDRYDVILAYALDGKSLEKSDKGPLWIMYPFDAHPLLDVDEYASHAVWQVRRLGVK